MSSRCALLLVFFGLLASVSGARILAISPTYATSHFRMMKPLLLRLADSGHQVTVLSFYPLAEQRPNYVDIDLRSTLEPFHLNCSRWNMLQDIYELFTYGTETLDIILASDPVQNFLKSDQQFDLVILEAFASDVVLGFPAFFKAPYIGFSTMALPPWLADWIWNPVESSFVPDHICRETRVDIIGRGLRLACQSLTKALNYWYNTRPALQLVHKYFGLEIDSLNDIKANMSLMFVNTAPALGGVRPHLPNVIEVGGIHLAPVKPLPAELSQWMNACANGVILFSMGSMVQAASMDTQIRDSMVDIFRRLDHCVLWKWESKIDRLPENVRTVTWLPQADVLAHPNVRVFISHGGFHGLMEAIFHGVPVVGIPLYGDQMANIDLLEIKGVAVETSFDPFSASHFESAIHQVLQNSSYRDNAKKLSRLIRDVEKSPLDTAVWWTEYVLRHNGAPHLQHLGVHLTWWQYYMLDVFFATAVLLFITKKFLRALLKFP